MWRRRIISSKPSRQAVLGTCWHNAPCPLFRSPAPPLRFSPYGHSLSRFRLFAPFTPFARSLPSLRSFPPLSGTALHHTVEHHIHVLAPTFAAICARCGGAAALCYLSGCKNGTMSTTGDYSACAQAEGICDVCYPESTCGGAAWDVNPVCDEIFKHLHKYVLCAAKPAGWTVAPTEKVTAAPVSGRPPVLLLPVVPVSCQRACNRCSSKQGTACVGSAWLSLAPPSLAWLGLAWFGL